jgi:hypothetical protein
MYLSTFCWPREHYIVTCFLINLMCCWCLICLLLLQLRQCTDHKPNLGCCYTNASKHMISLCYLSGDSLATHLNIKISSLLADSQKGKQTTKPSGFDMCQWQGSQSFYNWKHPLQNYGCCK